MPQISATATGRVNWGSSTDCFSACVTAKNNALRILNAKALLACPNGYAVTSGPDCSTESQTSRCSVGWEGWWPDVYCSDNCTAEIECNNSGQFPDFLVIAYGEAIEAWRETLQQWGIHYEGVRSGYEALSKIRDVEQLVRAVEESAETRDLEIGSFLEAHKKGKIREVCVPKMETLLKDLDLWGNGAITDPVMDEIRQGRSRR